VNAPVNIPLVRHFIDIHEVDQKHLRSILQHAQSRKLARKGYTRGRPDADLPLKGQTLAMIFDKPSTRTRVSFDMAMRQLGGDTIMLTGAEMQLGRGETIADTARVLSRYVDAIVIRTGKHETVKELAEHATVPVINGLTYKSHPCQLMASNNREKTIPKVVRIAMAEQDIINKRMRRSAALRARNSTSILLVAKKPPNKAAMHVTIGTIYAVILKASASTDETLNPAASRVGGIKIACKMEAAMAATIAKSKVSKAA
jgi:hypothetical protein